MSFLPSSTLPESCPDCGSEGNQPHDEECILAEHEAVLRGDTLAAAVHDTEECELCLLQHEVRNACRCGLCCQGLLIEASELDAQREPKIARYGRKYRDIDLYLLNRKDGGGCVFFHRDEAGRGVCEIYDTRPLCCRLFNCDTDERAIEYRERLSDNSHA